MLTDANRKLSIIAYYLSKFDKDAIHTLGYDTFSSAFEGISAKFGKSNNYMKLRRDEFDALTGSTRKGWHKRAPSPGVLLMHNDLKNYSFEEMTQIITDLINDSEDLYIAPKITASEAEILTDFSEEEIEQILNHSNVKSKIITRIGAINSRVFDDKVQKSLKALYRYRCQICGATATVMYGVDVSEAHHIEYFSKSANNSPRNIIILCPDHHRIVHKAKALFNYEFHRFEYENAKTDPLMYNLHL